MRNNENHLSRQKPNSLIFETLDSCHFHLDSIIDQIRLISLLYQSGEDRVANDKFSEMLESLNLYFILISRIYHSLDVHFSKNCKSEQTSMLEDSLVTLLNRILRAKELNDISLIADLLEYELIDNLISWKMQALPELEKLKIT